MDPFVIFVVLVVAVAAFAAGYFIGHFKALADVRGGGAWSPAPGPSSPLPGPEDGGRYGDAPSSAPSRPRGAPPPTSAGGSNAGAGSGARRPPQRSTKPPPAIAGLMGRITGSKRDDSPK